MTPPPERCRECVRDATHTVVWHGTRRRWRRCTLTYARKQRRRIVPYCAWHATVHTTQRNARGVVPPERGRATGVSVGGEEA